MKRKMIILTMSLLLVSTFLYGCSSKDGEDKSLEQVIEKGEFVVGLDDSFPPMGFRDDNGEIVGLDIDLAKEAAERMGVKVIFKPVEWDGVVLSLKNGDIDVIWNGLTITEDRQKQINFTKTYLENRQIIVVTSDSQVNNKEDLKDKILGVQLGSSSETALLSDSKTANSTKEIKKYSNNTEALMDLKIGRIDGVVVDEIVGRYYMEKRPGEYRVLDENFGKEAYGVGVRKEDISFLNELNKVLEEMKADGKAEEISKKWFGEDIITR